MKKILVAILGLAIVVFLIAVALVGLQQDGIIQLAFVETIRTQGLITGTKNLWLEHVTPLWNEYVLPSLK